MGLVVGGIAVCVIAVMIIAFMFVCFANAVGNANNKDILFALILGIVLVALFCIGRTMVQVGMTEQQTIQVESGNISES